MQVRSDITGTPITLSKQDDPQGRVAKMANEWIVDHRIKAWLKKAEGGLESVNTYAIRRGDLVDVLVVVEIVTMRGKGGKRVEVHFSPQEIVRLESAARMHVSREFIGYGNMLILSQALSKRTEFARSPTVVAERKQTVVDSFGVRSNIVAGIEDMEI